MQDDMRRESVAQSGGDGAPEPGSGEGVPASSEEAQWDEFTDRVAVALEEPPQPEQVVVKAFDDRWHAGFEGLLYLGRLEHEFHFAGHTFVVRTLTSGEHLEVSQICKPFEDSVAYIAALRVAVAAGGIVSVDGQPIPVALKGVSPIRQRMDWMAQNWFDPVVEEIYLHVDWLESQSVAILNALGVYDPDKREIARLTG